MRGSLYRMTTAPGHGLRAAACVAACIALWVAPVAAEAEVAAARTYIISPADGATVSSPFTVRFGLNGMGVAPAGVAVEGTGHHHLLVNTQLPDLEAPIPADERHLHFGKGQTETLLELPPGQHTLQLLFGDSLHRPHRPPVYSERITVTVR